MKAPAHVFRTITDPDWARMLAAHRAQGHYHGSALLAQIRAAVAAKFPRQVTAQSESRPFSQPAATRRPDAFLSFTAASSADRKGGGTPRAEAGGGGSNFVGETVTILPRPGGNEATEGDAGADMGGEFLLGKQSDNRERPVNFQL